MSDFFLLQLPPLLVGKIISKTDPKSNFRLRQTCRTVHELIKENSNITVSCAGSSSIRFKNQNFVLSNSYRHSMGEITIDVEGLYGARMKNLSLSFGMDDTVFQRLYGYLQQYRFTCEKVYLMEPSFSKEQHGSLLKFLKPTTVRFIRNEDSKLIDAVFDCKTLRRVEVVMLPGDAVTVMKKLLSHFPEVDVSVTPGAITGDDTLPLLKQALETLLSTPSSANIRLRFRLFGEEYSKDHLERAFRALIWTRTLIEGDYGFVTNECVGVVQLPSTFPQNSTCRIIGDYNPVNGPVTYELQYDTGISLPSATICRCFL